MNEQDAIPCPLCAEPLTKFRERVFCQLCERIWIAPGEGPEDERPEPWHRVVRRLPKEAK